MRLMVLVAYRASPAALAANGTLEYPRSYYLLELVDCFVCLSFHPVKEPCPFEGFPPPGPSGEQGIRTLDPRLAEPMLWPAELAPLGSVGTA